MSEVQAAAREQQHTEELCIAAIRALARERDLHFRGRRLHRGRQRLPLYAPHLATTAPYGLSPLEDQQLAGLIMWVPASLPYLAVALLRLAGLFGSEGRRAA